MTRIEVQRLVHVYPRGTRALDGLDLVIGQGEAVALVGQNGSGKSTLVRHLNGLLRPTAGAILLDGVDTARTRVAQLSRRVGVTFQNPDRQLFASRVGDEVAFGARNVGLRGIGLEAAVREALEAAGLTGRDSTNPYDLGYSQRKLLALASVLAMRTPVVVLDEPTTGQDARGVRRVESIVRGLAEAGRTVIAVTHDMRFVADNFHRVVVMQAGRITADGPPETVFGEAAWPILGATNLEPPHAALVGARLGLGSTPTDDAVVRRLLASADR